MTDQKAQTAREKTIDEITARHLLPEKFAFLSEGQTYPIDGGIYGHAGVMYNITHSALNDIAKGYMDELRDTGLLMSCPNNGPRNVRPISAWNAWLDGRDLKENAPWWMETSLFRAPAFSLLTDNFYESLVEVEMRLEREASPDGKISASRIDKIPLRPQDLAEVVQKTIDKTKAMLKAPEVNPLRMRSDLSCSLTGERVFPMGKILAPVLGKFCGKAGRIVELPVLEQPKIARHMVMSVPSGQIVMADWFRIKGFNEGLKSALPESGHFNINGAAGLDDRMKAYYETFGLVIVQVHECSPSAYHDTAGVWRMGSVDEEDDYFYTCDGEKNAPEAPKEEWTTCTDVWANTFADREVIVDILMASGEYEDRGFALLELESYVEDTYGATFIDIGSDALHVYAPTGYGVNTNGFTNEFRAAELEYPEWRSDKYILSTQELTVDPELLEAHDWREGRVTAVPADPDTPEDMTP